ncbi:unnamed protein product [Blepharisma stoltei]|uniref:Uncharacterized protein n=1 Tax=Blepharisma stoltei TaxID=1481888 RepID=A0AAU9K5P0_9CILI|nr:unnamed protein product [Blepharisma stoltei]
MSFSLRVRKLTHEISKHHKLMFQLLNSQENNEDDSKITIDKKTYEEILKISTKLFEKDCLISNMYRQKSRSKINIITISQLKSELSEIKKIVQSSTIKMTKDLKRLGLILRDYKDRCKDSFIQFLKNLDVDLRKSLKPLVPSEILEEQISYKPIADIASYTATSKSISNLGDPSSDRKDREITDTKTEMLTKHIQLLVNTLEDVAKKLIEMTKKTEKSYYEIVNPKVLDTEPPSPLAAPFPDYFSFDVTNLSEENRENSKWEDLTIIDELSRKNILMKFVSNESLDSINPKKTKEIKDKIERLLNENAKENEILELFKEEEIPVTKREQLVFDIINSGRKGDNTVTLTDLIEASNVNTKRNLESNRNKSNFEVSGSNYSQIVKQIQGKELTDKLDESVADFKSLDSSIDEKMVRPIERNRERIKSEMILKYSEPSMKVLPPVSIKSKGKELQTKKSLKCIRIRSVTPGKKMNEESKKSIKRSKTPFSKKRK